MIIASHSSIYQTIWCGMHASFITVYGCYYFVHPIALREMGVTEGYPVCCLPLSLTDIKDTHTIMHYIIALMTMLDVITKVANQSYIHMGSV